MHIPSISPNPSPPGRDELSMRGDSAHNAGSNVESWVGSPTFESCRGSGRRLSKVVVGRGGALRESSSGRRSWEGTSWEPLFHVFGPQIIFIWSLKYNSADLRESWVRRPSIVVGPPTFDSRGSAVLRESWVRRPSRVVGPPSFESRESAVLRESWVRRLSRVVGPPTFDDRR